MKNKKIRIIVFLLTINLILIGVFGKRIIGLFPGWHKDSNGEFYVYSFGERLKGIKSINDTIIYFNEDGYRTSGLIEYENKKYYFYPEGGYATGEIKINNESYIFDSDGTLLEGFVNKNGTTYLYDDHGYIQKGEVNYNNEKYLINDDGSFVTGIYIDEDGNYKGNDDHGYPLYGVSSISGRTYVFDDDGIMLRDGFYLGYYIDENGIGSKAEQLDISSYNLTTNSTYITDPEVDKKIDEVLSFIINDDMSEYEQLRAVYEWSLRNVQYVGEHIELTDGFDPIVAKLAEYALDYRKGACYHFASVNLYLLNRLGFQALIAPGYCTTVDHGWTEHYWNMVVYEGNWYHFDPMLEQAYAPYDTFLKRDEDIYNYSTRWTIGDIPESGKESVR